MCRCRDDSHTGRRASASGRRHRHAYVLYLCCAHACRPSVPVRPPRSSPPAADRVYAHVKQGVLERRYEGGTLLTEGELAEAVGVSRTPVREALLRLEVEGLIRLYPKKGALVLPVSAQEIADVVETRRLVEEHAARKAVPAPPRLWRGWRNCSPAAASRPPPATWPRAAVTDRCFHAEIVRSGGNEILSRLYDQLRDRQLRMGVAVMHAHPDRITKTLTEHEADPRGAALRGRRGGRRTRARPCELVLAPGAGGGPMSAASSGSRPPARGPARRPARDRRLGRSASPSTSSRSSSVRPWAWPDSTPPTASMSTPRRCPRSRSCSSSSTRACRYPSACWSTGSAPRRC